MWSMCFLKEKYYKEGNGGGKKYYCEYLKEYTYGCNKCCSNYKKDDKRSSDVINTMISEGNNYDDGISVSIYFALLFFLIILGLIMGVFQ